MGTRTSATPQTGHGFAGVRNSFMTDLVASGGNPGFLGVRDRSQSGCSGPSLPTGFRWCCGISCGLGVKHQEKKCRNAAKRHAGQKKRPLRGLECTEPTLAHDVRHHCRYALHFCLHGKRHLLKLYLRRCRDPRCDADHKSLIQTGQVAAERRPLWKTAGCPLTP